MIEDKQPESIWLKLEMRRIQDLYGKAFNESSRVLSLLSDQQKTKESDAAVVRRYLHDACETMQDLSDWLSDIEESCKPKTSKSSSKE